MTKEEIENRLKEFFKQRERSSKNLDDLCEENGFVRYKQRKKIVWGKRNPNNKEYHWDNLNLDEYTPNKPIVVCLSGNGTKSAKSANGMCKYVENLLDLMFKVKEFDIKAEDKIDIISCAYSYNLRYLFFPDDNKVTEEYPDIEKYTQDFPNALSYAKQNGYLGKSASQQFARNILLSKCLNKVGERLNVDKCQKNLSQIIFFTYCYGAKALNRIVKDFSKMLSQNGFNKREIEEIISSMSHISFARLEYTRTIPTTYFYAVNDFDLYAINQLLNKMDNSGSQLEIKLSKKGELSFGQKFIGDIYGKETNAEALEFAYMGIEKNGNEITNKQDIEHYLANLDRDKDWDIINKDKGIYNAISQMMSWALCRAVENGLDNAHSDKYVPKISMEQLKDELIDIYKSFSKEELMTKQ